jgi:hypothetical protein
MLSRLTSCHDAFEATVEFIRCNIYHDDLKKLALVESALLASQPSIPTTSSSSISTTITSRNSSSSSSSTSFTIAESSQTSNSTSSSTPATEARGTPSMTEPTITGTTNKPATTGTASPAFIAGAVAGPILAIIALVVLGWWWFFLARRQPTPKKMMERQEETTKLGQDVQLVEGHGHGPQQCGMMIGISGLVEVDGSRFEGGNHESSELCA